LNRRKRYTLVLPFTAVLVLLFDQISKYLVAARLPVGQSIEIAPWLAPVVRMTHVTNTGAAFGLFRGGGNFFIAITVIVIVAIIFYYRQIPAGQFLMRLALGLQLGGAIGNLVDRLRQGFVVDFIDLNFWPLQNWAVFNLADSSLVTGVILLALLMFGEGWREWENQQVAGDG